jgi:hypothetical protein
MTEYFAAQNLVSLDLPNVTVAVSMRCVTEREADDVMGALTKESRRHELFVGQLILALVSEPEAALDLAARYEQACLDEAARTPIVPVGEHASDEDLQFALGLVAEENRLAMRARLEWVRYVRRELKVIVSEQP